MTHTSINDRNTVQRLHDVRWRAEELASLAKSSVADDTLDYAENLRLTLKALQNDVTAILLAAEREQAKAQHAAMAAISETLNGGNVVPMRIPAAAKFFTAQPADGEAS